MVGTNAMFQPRTFQPNSVYGGNTMPTGQTSTRIMAPSGIPSQMSNMLPASLGMMLGARQSGMPGMYRPYNPYQGAWNSMAYQMAGLPSYAIPRAGNYYTQPDPYANLPPGLSPSGGGLAGLWRQRYG